MADIDGPSKGKSSAGSDVFLFNLDSQGNFLANPSGNMITTPADLSWGSSDLMTLWVIKNGNMDYQKITNGKCPNGTVLNWDSNTTCK